MKRFELEGINVKFYTDPLEFCKDYYEIPENAELDRNNLPESAGFACIVDNEIAIQIRNDCSFFELFSTVSHEVGHLIEGGFKKNPPDKNRYFKKHEQKAEHYEQFAIKSYRIAEFLFNNR
jgi:hypothetical protein